jgi:hypothetical protein
VGKKKKQIFHPYVFPYSNNKRAEKKIRDVETMTSFREEIQGGGLLTAFRERSERW